MFPFDPPENIRKPKVFWCFQGDLKGTLGRKEFTPNFKTITCNRTKEKIVVRKNVKQWEVYSGPLQQISKIESLLTMVVSLSILDVCRGPSYASANGLD